MAGANVHILTLTSQIVTAHVGHNDVGSDALAGLIRSVYNALADLSAEAAHAGLDGVADGHSQHNHHVHSAGRAAASGISGHVHPEYGQTVFDDHLICMEDGLSMKMLKRHLQTVHGMTPQQYRAKWGLPPDYPMVASNYAKLRSNLALESGLGLKPEARASRGARTNR